MKLEVFQFTDELSDTPFEVYEGIDGFLPLGETLLQVDVSKKETVLISGYAKVRVTRTDAEVKEMEDAIAEYERKQNSAQLSAKYLSL